MKEAGAAQSGAAPTRVTEKERAVMPELSLETVRKAFFENVLTLHNSPGHNHRLVGWADRLDQDNYEAKMRAIWNPNAHPDRHYNVVLSLASDGMHYPLIDWDLPDLPTHDLTADLGDWPRTHFSWLRSGSGNWHGYGKYPTTLEHAVEFAQLPASEDGGRNMYYHYVRRDGYAVLRPPWFPKGGLQPHSLLSSQFPLGFLDGVNEEDDTPTPASPWEELFND